MHFCSIRAKDYYQLKNRYYRRAKNIRLPYEVLTEEGLLLYSQIEGSVKNLEEFHTILISSLKIPEKYIFFDNKEIKVPFYFSIEDNFIHLLEEYDLKGYVIEITPFRESKYQQITEKTPLKIFKEEYGFNEN
jgi:pyruvate formate-lyase activating enzyme-like uncharacterized protein